jgi:hypothetical protein
VHVAGRKLGGEAIPFAGEGCNGMEAGLAKMPIVGVAFPLSICRVFGRVHVQIETILVPLFDQGIRCPQNGFIQCSQAFNDSKDTILQTGQRRLSGSELLSLSQGKLQCRINP